MNTTRPLTASAGRPSTNPTAPSSVSGIGGVQLIPEAAVDSYLQELHNLLSNKSSAASEIALSDYLDRQKLDFGLDSLREIDRYLSLLHDHEHEISGMPLLSTIWAIAFYVGEIIRREALEKQYQWVTIGVESVPAGFTTIKQAGIGAARGLCAKDGDMIMPALMVLRIILRGSKARSVDSCARGAIGLLK